MQISGMFNALLNTVRSDIVSKESDIVPALFISPFVTVKGI
jgi:hypothetical protein